MSDRRNPYLDVLRAVAVVAVIIGHLPGPPRDAWPPVVAIAEFFHRFGGLGVDLFFVLSGFLVSGLLFQEQRQRGESRIGRFLIRRGFKIYPAFYVFLTVTVALRVRYGEHLSILDMVSEALFVQNYAGHVWSHTWSLAVEEHFYLMLAAMVAVLQHVRRRDPIGPIPILFGVVAAGVLLARAVTIASIQPYSVESHRFPTHLQIDSLFFGVLLSYFFHTNAAFAPFVRSRLGAVLSIGAVSVVLAQSLPGPQMAYVLGHVLTFAGFGMFVLAAAVAPRPSRTGPALAVAAGIGEYSYSIYLWHTAVLVFGTILARKLLGREPGFYEVAAGYTSAAVVWGVLMARCIEGPALALRDRLSPSAQRSPRRAVAAVS